MIKLIKFASKISPENLAGIKKLCEKDGSKIYFHLNRAIKNYLKAKKVVSNEKK